MWIFMQPAPQLPKCTAGNTIDHTWDLRRLKASVNDLFPRQQRAQRSASAAADHKSSSDGVIYTPTASRAQRSPLEQLPPSPGQRESKWAICSHLSAEGMATTHLRAAATHHRQDWEGSVWRKRPSTQVLELLFCLVFSLAQLFPIVSQFVPLKRRQSLIFGEFCFKISAFDHRRNTPKVTETSQLVPLKSKKRKQTPVLDLTTEDTSQTLMVCVPVMLEVRLLALALLATDNSTSQASSKTRDAPLLLSVQLF